jgi:hypothetical protein
MERYCLTVHRGFFAVTIILLTTVFDTENLFCNFQESIWFSSIEVQYIAKFAIKSNEYLCTINANVYIFHLFKVTTVFA